ncbi:MAG: site-2 protease family protein, partial [Vitreimonas sp.]
FPPASNSWSEGGMIYISQSPENLIETTVRALASVNLALGAFNLLPGLPLDGGHVLRSALSAVMPSRRAHAIAAFSGLVVGLGVVAYAVRVESLWMLLIGVFVLASAWDARHPG